MEMLNEVEPAGLKRRRSSSDSTSYKYPKYNSLLPLLKHEICESSKTEAEALIKKNVDIDEYDPKADECTPLYYAVQKGWLGWTKFLLENGADQTFASIGSEVTLSDMAWSKGYYDIVFELIFADGPYPLNFVADKLTMVQKLRIKTFQLRVDKLHKQLKESSLDEVASLAENNPKTKHAYDTKNKSVLTTALESKNFKIYSFLRSQGFACGIDNIHDTLLAKLKKKEKDLLDSEIKKYFQCADFLILNLLSKSQLGMNNDQRHFGKLKNYFEELDKHKEIQPILKLIANEKSLSMIFDFNRKGIENLDPARCPLNSLYTVSGRTHKKNKKILIAAKQKYEGQSLGILAQELTHFALLKVYGNKFLPYHSNDLRNEARYAGILESCYYVRDQEEIISRAFRYDEGKEGATESTENQEMFRFDEAIAAEVIARVPQLVAQNSPEKLSENRETYKDLFDYYNRKVFIDLELEVSLIEPKQSVQNLNKTFGLLHRLKTTKMHCIVSKMYVEGGSRPMNEPGNVFVLSKIPELVLSNICEKLANLNDSENLFIELYQLEKDLSSINDIVARNFKPKLFILDSLDVGYESVPAILNKVGECKIVLVSSRSFEPLQEMFEFHLEVCFEFSELTCDSKQVLLGSLLSFQGVDVKLKDILGDDLEDAESWPLEEILDAFKIKINVLEKFLPKTSEVLVPRSFQLSGTAETLSAEEVVAKLEAEKTIVIVDVAGMGKTTSAVNFAKDLKRRHQLSWIAFFDLKQHTEVFESRQNNQNADLVLQLMLKLKSEIEKKLFDFLFRNQKAIFVIDGFDEISPRFGDLIIELMQHIKRYGNLLLITTRTHLRSVIAEQLSCRPILHLLPFTEENQVEFLTKFWSSREKSANEVLKSVNQTELADKARQLLQKFRSSLIQKQIFLEIPLQLFMLADVTSDNPGILNIDFRLFSLYEHFIENKLSIWIRTPLALTDILNIFMKQFDFMLFHQKIAIGAIYGRKVVESLQLPNMPQTIPKEVICRIGFLQVGVNGDYQFDHQTFGDYFVAKMLLNSITTEAFANSFGVLHDLLAKALIGSSHYDGNIRNFMNEKVDMNDVFFHLAELTRKLEEHLKADGNYSFLIKFVERKQFNLISLVLKKLDLKKELKLKLITHKDSLNNNALHAATASVSRWTFLWNCIEGFTNERDRRDISLVRGGVEDASILELSQSFEKVPLYQIMSDIYDKLWNRDNKLIEAMLQRSEKVNSQKNAIFEQLWDSVEECFSSAEKKQILFHPCKLFNDLVTNDVGVKTALSAVNKLLNPEELKSFVNSGWFYNGRVRHALGLEHGQVLSDFLQNSTGYEKKQLETFFEGVIVEKSPETEDSQSENFLITKTFNALSEFIKKFDFKEKNSTKLFNWVAKNLLQISANHSRDYFSQFWEFVQKFLDENEQKKVLLLQSQSRNALMAAMLNEDKSSLTYVFEILAKLFEKSDIKQALCNTDDKWLLDTLCYYAEHADAEAFGVFWSFLQDKLDKDDQKLIFLQKNQKKCTAFMISTQNKNKCTIAFVINIARDILDREDFVTALSSEDQNWVVDTVCRYALSTSSDVYEMLWSFLVKKLGDDLLLQKRKIALIALGICYANKDQQTIKFIIKAAESLLSRDDYAKALNSTDEYCLVAILCRFALKAEFEVFGMLWSLLEDNLDIEDQKLVFLQRERRQFMDLKLNAFIASAYNKNKSTTKLVIEIAFKLLNTDDFTKALKSEDQNWVVDILCRHASFSAPDVFETFWSFLEVKLTEADRFLQVNLTKADMKLVFLQKNMNGLNAFMASAQNENLFTIERVINAASDLLGPTDFVEALESKDQNWVVDTLCEYVVTAEYKSFEMLWSFLKKKRIDDLKSLFLMKKENGINAFVALAQCTRLDAAECVVNILRDLLSSDDFTEALESEDGNWVVDFLIESAAKAKPEAFKMFWCFLQEKLDAGILKSIFLQKHRNGVNAFMASARNKNKSTIERVLDTTRVLLRFEDFDVALKSGDQNWIVDALGRYAAFAQSEAFGIFWSFLRENLRDHHNLKLMFSQKDQNGLDALMSSAFNEDKQTFSVVLKLHKEFFEESSLGDTLFFIFWFNNGDEDFDQLGIHFESKDFPKYLKRKYNGLYLLYFLSLCNDHVVLKTLWKTTRDLLDPQEIRKQLLDRDQDGNNAFSIAAIKMHSYLLFFLNWVKENFSNELLDIFRGRNKNQEAILHVVASKWNKNMCQGVLDFVSSSFKVEEIRKILLETNKKGESTLEVSRRNRNKGVAQVFSKFNKIYFPVSS